MCVAHPRPRQSSSVTPDQPWLEQQVFRRQHQAKDKHLQALIQELLIATEMGGLNGRIYSDTLSAAQRPNASSRTPDNLGSVALR